MAETATAVTRDVDENGVAVLTLDDGKVNAFDAGRFAALGDALDACADDAAVVVAGRPGVFSAGLDRKALDHLDDDGLEELLVVFGRTFLRLWLEPRPVVAAATGHAVAAGTILAMVCDHAVAADGEYAWGLNETAIGFPLPQWVVAVSRANVRADRLEDLVLPGTLVDPATAVDVGFADAVAAGDDVLAAATARAHELATLPAGVYAESKRRLRGAAAEEALEGLAADTRALLAALPGRRGRA